MNSTGPQKVSASTGGGQRRGLNLGWVAVPVAIFAIVSAVFGLALTSGDPSKLPSALLGKPAPQLDLPALEGLVNGGKPVAGVTGGDLKKGEVTVVNFWASWCVPCVEEHPLLIELKQRTGVTLYGINYKDQTAAARRFLGNFGNPFSGVGVDATGRAGIEWGVYGMPETFVVDGQGRIAYKHVGPLTKATLEGKMIPAIDAARRGAKAGK
jgi:cytochrome c biogenesis protein CcmG/thiol:disulfide interchange protein DsbE